MSYFGAAKLRLVTQVAVLDLEVLAEAARASIESVPRVRGSW